MNNFQKENTFTKNNETIKVHLILYNEVTKYSIIILMNKQYKMYFLYYGTYMRGLQGLTLKAELEKRDNPEKYL